MTYKIDTPPKKDKKNFHKKFFFKEKLILSSPFPYKNAQ